MKCLTSTSGRVRSTGVAGRFQQERLGEYTFVRHRHGRKVYKKRKEGGGGVEERDQFVYYHDWGPNSGSNWMIGVNPQTNSRSKNHDYFQLGLYGTGWDNIKFLGHICKHTRLFPRCPI